MKYEELLVRCACGDCYDFAMDEEMLDYVANTRKFEDAFVDGLEPHRYCITCYNKNCHQGKPHVGGTK